ncbi:MAG TPA: baseplate J/gp47 family protein [Kofleriaceae bacterium]
MALARDFPDPPSSERDGTSQAGRAQPALDPAYVAVDERSARDLLVLAHAYTRQLNFYDAQDRLAGDWTGFLGNDDLEALAALVDDSGPPGPSAVRMDRPHVALFLAFLRLLRHPRDLVNTLTARHLTFYYTQLLQMSRTSAVGDRVHVLVKLATGVDQARLPQGTALRAGKDSLGREQIYRTDRELVVSRAKLARLSSVYAQKEIVGLREAREHARGTREEAFLAMLRIALGAPRPGDPLPQYGGKDVTYPLLLELKQRVDFAAASLFMDFSDLHAMMQLVRRRAADAGDWATINAILEKAGQTRLHDPTWKLNPANPRDFSANLAKALGGAPDFQRDGLSGVNSLADLYYQLFRADVIAYVHDKLFLSEADFRAMMGVKIPIDAQWGEIDRILEQAGRRRWNNPTYRLHPADPTAFAANLQAAIGPVPFSSLPHAILPAIADIGAYYDAILALEAYFHMNAAQLGYVLATAEKPAPSATPREWDTVYRILSDAHRDLVNAQRDQLDADRRQALQKAREAAPNAVQGFLAVLRIALGMGAASQPSLADLRPDVQKPEDYSFLESVQSRLVSGTITPAEWSRVYQVVVLAQRVRDQLPDPVAQRETWLDLRAADDATAIAAGPAELPRWRTFGQTAPVTSTDAPHPALTALIGWAISSPLLVVTQGTRTLTLTLGVPAKDFGNRGIVRLLPPYAPLDQLPFELQISTEKGWLPLTVSAVVGDYRTLSQVSRAVPDAPQAIQLTATLADDAAPAAPNQTTAWAGGYPVLRLLLRRIWDASRGQYISLYEPFRDLPLVAAHLRVSVTGLTPSSIQNDDAVLNARKPFEPFGSRPAVGSRFYVADPELVIKRLDGVAFHIDWMGVPADLAQHYANYDVAGQAFSGTFTAQVSLIDNHLRMPLSTTPSSLFASGDPTKRQDLAFAGLPTMLERAGYHYAPSSLPPGGPEVTAWPRYFEWELTPTDFKHQAYPAAAAQRALELTAALIKTPATANPASYQVKPPYTPKIKALRIDYAAQTEVVLDAAQPAAGTDRLFHIHPFGASPIAAEADATGTPLLPRYEHEGELYLGIQNARPPETLSLLFEMADGSANPDLPPVNIEWSYLSGDAWVTLQDGHVLLDTTNGLIDSGIVQIALPPADPSTRLPGDLYWIRAAIANHPDSVCDTVGIHTQAVSATFDDHGNAPDHHAHALPARSIAGLAQRVPQIAGVEQPYPSRGGRAAEAERGFFTRISERLRHKQRALTPWDYERLVLERFPGIGKVKCLPADPDNLGAVQIIVIPQIQGQSLANRFEPKVSAAQIADITAYLAGHSPPHAALHVRNARFVQVKVRVGVRFQGTGDDGFYRSLLDDELVRYLSPWAFDDGADIAIGGKIFANSIVSFVDGRDYVDYVANIELFSSNDGGRTFQLAVPQPSQGYFVSTDQPDAVLVTAPDHDIDIIPDTGYTAVSFTGINYMKIELDFIVAGSA